ncbi:hypothetical protein [Pseudomonas palmensis]|uniref:hypothetical protein n=1 Tax=Pseudomonas palmensis TaxID=2815362 RepID=UPI001AE99DDC|nr:hypothetical protein [Pseudomonas palmensis]
MPVANLIKVSDIPYFDMSQAGGKFFGSLIFFGEGKWRSWLHVGGGNLEETGTIPAEGCYYGTVPERPTDLFLSFLDFILQRASFSELKKPIAGIQDDLFNLSASLAKVAHIHKTRGSIGLGAGRMIITEIEYVFSICRSMIDLFQEVVAKLWEKVRFKEEYALQKKKLKTSFREMVWFQGKLSTQEELESRFGLPSVWAKFYLRHVDFFQIIRVFRDNIIHNGSQVQTVFEGDHDYLLNFHDSPFVGMGVWYDKERVSGDFVPLMPALAMVAYRTILICDDFAEMVTRTLEPGKPLVPGMTLFMRGFFNEHFTTVLDDAQKRYLLGVEQGIRG